MSHEHGDHYDFNAVRSLLKQTKCRIYAPRVVIRDAVRRGLDASRFKQVYPERSFWVSKMKITPYPSANSERVNPVDRVGFLIESNEKRLFHQGDSHSYSPTWRKFGGKLDALIMWPNRVSEVMNAIRPRTVIFHHLDRFRPGNFFCNRSAALELHYWSYYNPKIHFVVPKRNTWLPVKPLDGFRR